MFGFNNDKELVNRAKEGDEKALEELFKKHKGYLYGRAKYLTKNNAQANDVFSEAVEKITDNIKTLNGLNFKSWAKRIVTNTFIDYKRNIRNKPKETLDNPSVLEVLYQKSVDEFTEPSNTRLPYEVLERLKASGFGAETFAKFHELVKQQSTPKCNKIIRLYFFEGYTHKQIAEIMEGHTKNRLYECLEKLRKLFNEKKSSGK